MRRSILILAILLGLFGARGYGAEKETEKGKEWYLKQYPYLTPDELVRTCESEFKWPEGFRRLDSDKLTPFQNWVSHIPMWDDGKSVYSITTGTILRREQISRSIHYPWRTGHFRDCIIPLQLLTDYKFWTDRPDDLAIVTKKGDTVTYKKFLQSEISYDPYFRINFVPAQKRKPSVEEFNGFVDLFAFNSDYASLEKQCDPIVASNFRPGDLYVGRDSIGVTGKVYVILVVASNSRGDFRYVVGTGCPEPCDFYVPLFHDDRSNPWLTPDELKALITGYPMVGFYRLKVPGKK